jgi:hypothetical protein
MSDVDRLLDRVADTIEEGPLWDLFDEEVADFREAEQADDDVLQNAHDILHDTKLDAFDSGDIDVGNRANRLMVELQDEMDE